MHIPQIGFVASIFTLTAALAVPNGLTTNLELSTLVERQSSGCTEYCSDAVGCVCRSYPADCTASYLVQPGDGCLAIAEKFDNFTVSQLYRWNPDMGLECYLQAYVPLCINTPDYVFTPPVQAPYGTHRTREEDPVPIMFNIVKDCEDFELVESGTRVETLAQENGFAVEDFAKWNGNQTTAWADYWACVKAPETSSS